MATNPYTCKNCGGPLLPRRGGGQHGGGGKPQVHCSDKCRREWARKQHLARRWALRPTECPECGATIKQNEIGKPKRFCSAQCKRRYHNRRLARARRPALTPQQRICAECGTSFIPKRRHGVYCSEACWGRAYWQRKSAGIPRPTACVICGQTFTPIRITQRYCSKACRSRFWMKVKQKRKRQLDPGDYSDRQVFERDNWTCHICGEAIDFTVKWPDRMCATVDHVVPVAKGGNDDLNNVAAAHWKCNHEKGSG